MQTDWMDRIEQSESLHAVLLVGAREADLVTPARRAAARYLLHTDRTEQLNHCPFFLVPVDDSVESIRRATEALLNQTYDRGKRVLLISDVHRLNAQSQNALLKTLEEPPEGALLLLTGQEAGILPTVLSRCVILRFASEPIETVAAALVQKGIPRERAMLAARLSDGVLSRAERYAEDEYQAFRAELMKHVNAILVGMRPYSEAITLCTELVAEEEGEEEEAERQKQPKKKKKASERLADRYLTILLSILGDTLRLHVGYTDCANTDCVPLQKKLASTFTISQIQGMMGVVTEGLHKLSYKASPERVLTWTLAALTEKDRHG